MSDETLRVVEALNRAGVDHVGVGGVARNDRIQSDQGTTMMICNRSFQVTALASGLAFTLPAALWLSSCTPLGDHDSASQEQRQKPSKNAPDQTDAQAPSARYVFLFIGDGMSSVQVHAAEAYLANRVEHDEVGGSPKMEPLSMNTLPVLGMQRTFPWNSLITDSAPAGTAIATGSKTAYGVISMDASQTVELTTIAEVAKRAGMKVGIISSASIDHATPAVFYAHEPSRNNYHYIGHDLVNSGFDYFGGGGFLDPDGVSSGVTPQGNVIAAAESAGYVVADTRSEFESLLPGARALAISPMLDDKKALYYDIDRSHAQDRSDHISLAEFTQKGIELLRDENGAGFFMMVEGGKIDWACHANDARTVIDEVLAFDESVAVAIAFMEEHRQETLVVVTGDHETGGMALGWAGTAYESHFENLEPQKISFLEFDKRITDIKIAGDLPQLIVDTTLDEDMLEFFGLDYSSLTPFEKQRLDDAYTKALLNSSSHDAEEDSLLYGGHNPLSVTITHILNSRAGIGWTSYAHTAAPVPVLAGGANSNLFAGYYDNTDLARKLAAAMQVSLPN